MTLLTPTILLLGWSIWATVRWAHEHPDDDALGHHSHTLPKENHR